MRRTSVASFRCPQLLTALFLECDNCAGVLGVCVSSPRPITATDVLYRAPRPNVAPGGLVRMLVGLGASYVVHSEAELFVDLSRLICLLDVRAVFARPAAPSTVPTNIQHASHRQLPVIVRMDDRKGANFLVADVAIPVDSAHGASVLLTVSLDNSPLFISEVQVVAGHLHSLACNHSRVYEGSAFEGNAFCAAADGDTCSLYDNLQPKGWALWMRGGRGGSTEEMNTEVSESSVPMTRFWGTFVFPQGSTMLVCAASWGNADVVRILLDAGANVNASNEEGNTALHYASLEGDDEIVQLLLADFRTDVNFSNASGSTALHVAAYKGHAAVLSTLLADTFLDTSIINNSGFTALDIADSANDAEILALVNTEVGQRWR